LADVTVAALGGTSLVGNVNVTLAVDDTTLLATGATNVAGSLSATMGNVTLAGGDPAATPTAGRDDGHSWGINRRSSNRRIGGLALRRAA
jgi:hypothetical protein